MQRILFAALLTVAAASMAADSTLQQLAGRYTHRFKNGDVSRDVYNTTDIVEILPLDATRAAINLELNFFNGHSCSVGGVATLDGDRIVYQEAEPNPWSDKGCRLEIWRDRNKLRWTEGEGTSCQSYCGARGGLSTGEISYRSRRKISADRAKQLRENPDDTDDR
jgi:hypothetical protein